ncbi:MAG: AAA family ATPase [Candidatus Poribacteria bacterium]|nr:AAA family ATPase [Candidatus Poribacteria bacterium]
MLTKLICRNFKNFGEVEVELGNPVVFIGPNNSGKTTALQALALWEIGLKRWNENRKGRTNPEKRPGVAINRRDLISVPVPSARLLWRDLQVRDVERVEGRQLTQNVRIDIIVEGVTDGKGWQCGFEFDYANQESFYCRPLRISETDEKGIERMPVPDEAEKLSVAFLPPMSGLASNEIRLDEGAINVRIGEGRTAEVLRNLCYQVSQDEKKWEDLCKKISDLFGVQLDRPDYIQERGEIAMNYQDESGISLDLSSSGRGLQQTLLLLAYIAAHPGAVLLLDEPDAHLEILRQRQIYQILTESAIEHGSQIIAASHSEVILNEAADRDVVIAFLGKPHRIDGRGSQLLKSLRTIGFEQYYQAEQNGWVLYLEGPTDLAILRAFAEKLSHDVLTVLKRPYVHYVGNQPGKARDHFYGLREAKPDLVAFCLFDRISDELRMRPELIEYAWQRREIENYIVSSKQVLIDWLQAKAEERAEGPLFSALWVSMMKERIQEIEKARETLGQESPWSPDIKITDDFLDRLFETFFQELQIPNLMQKTNYHTLVRYVTSDQIDPEVIKVLDGILEVANKAVPLSGSV